MKQKDVVNVIGAVLCVVAFILVMFLFTQMPSDKTIANELGTFIGEVNKAKDSVK
jgi:hypothetical protein